MKHDRIMKSLDGDGEGVKTPYAEFQKARVVSPFCSLVRKSRLAVGIGRASRQVSPETAGRSFKQKNPLGVCSTHHASSRDFYCSPVYVGGSWCCVPSGSCLGLSCCPRGILMIVASRLFWEVGLDWVESSKLHFYMLGDDDKDTYKLGSA